MAPSLSPERVLAGAGELLLGLARASIRHGLEEGTPLAVDLAGLPPALGRPRATFVTLRIGGGLRGCTGRLEATRPLALDVAENAFAAAFLDPRFPPLGFREWEGLEVSISLLTRPRPLPFTGEEDLIRQLVPGRDGLVLSAGPLRATFLPSVWDELPDPRDFVRELKAKAGCRRIGEARRYRVLHIP
ncbi:AmmeMemoRadiSam system protein A [Mesoterricola silvestris]|uniref:AMMECR1 domain-containing protein n=1 Tax=Mesoterricola silvestris TaxID=2927979 RepID=A0AA48GFU7_9BACT|nr:AmmeMemoRadiSam system protein A [Mesoterricola silvestris]BDU71936.1 hypothetical protein METEAL_11100 [Mesoterricola silvestris]